MSEPYEDDIRLIAEKLGELHSRARALEEREVIALAPLDAAAAVQDASMQALQAALAGLKALDIQNPGVVALRELKNLSAETQKAVGVLMADINRLAAQSEKLSIDGKQHSKEFSATLQEVRDRITQAVTHFSGEIGQLRSLAIDRGTLTPCGHWDPDRTYDRGDMVELNGSSYVSMEGHNREKPSKRAKKWMLSAAAGKNLVYAGGPTTIVNTEVVGMVLVDEDDVSVTLSNVEAGDAISFVSEDSESLTISY